MRKESKLKSAASSRLTTYGTRSILAELAEPLVPVPPDGGWGWIVVTISTLIMFCIDGIGYCFAIFFNEIKEEFQCSLTDIAITSSVTGGFYYLLGPITCSALNRFGFQIIALIGGLLACLALLGASFMTSIAPFIVFIGVLGGTAFNLMYTPSVIAIGFYFERWRALAMAISCCGSSLGVMLFPIIMEHLFKNLTWRTKFRYMAGVFVGCGLGGLTYKTIKTTKVERNVQFGQTSNYTINTETEVKPGAAGIAAVFQRFKNALFPTISEVSVPPGGESAGQRTSKTSSMGYGFYLINKLSDEDFTSTYIRPDSEATLAEVSNVIVPSNIAETHLFGSSNWKSKMNENCRIWEIYRHCCKKCCCGFYCCQCFLRNHEISLTDINRPLYRDDIFYGGSVFRLSQYSAVSVPAPKGVPSLAYTLSVSRAPTQRDMDQQTQCVCCPEAVVRVLATMLSFQMLKSPTFIILLFSGYLSLMGTFIVFTYIGPYAQETGVDEKISLLLLSLIGVSNTVGRAVCGGISCFPVLDMNLLSSISISISGISIICSAFATSQIHFMIACSLFGFSLASFAVLRPLVFVEMFGLENLTNCFGLNMIFQSLAAFTSTPIASFIFKNTGSFFMVFLFTGSALLFSGIILMPLKYILKWEQKRRKRVSFVQ